MEPHNSHPHNSDPGLIGGIASLAKNSIGLLMSRIELAAIELAEVRANVLKLAVFFALGVIVALYAIGYWTVTIAYLAWPALEWKILLIIALACTAIAVGIFFYILSLVKGKLSLTETMNELRKDHDALR